MTNTMRFGRKLNLPSTVQIKHQFLTFWLKNQTAKESAEAATSAKASAPHFDVTAMTRSPQPLWVFGLIGVAICLAFLAIRLT
jgi:hypothetical protein